MATLDKHYPNIVEFPKPLAPGDRIGGDGLLVLEVVALTSMLTVAGQARQVFVAVHEKRRDGSMLTMFVCLDGRQRAWWAAEIMAAKEQG